MSSLTRADIAGAVAITNDPEATVKLYSDAKARMGADEFSKQMASLFNGDRCRYELVERSQHILVRARKTPTALRP